MYKSSLLAAARAHHLHFFSTHKQSYTPSQRNPETGRNNQIFSPPPGDSPYEICSDLRGCTEISMLHHNENIRSKEGTL